MLLETATKGSIMSGKSLVCSWVQLKGGDKQGHFPGTMRGLVSQEAFQSISICGGQWPCVMERRRTSPCWWPCPSLAEGTAPTGQSLKGLIHGQTAPGPCWQGHTTAGGWHRGLLSTFLTSGCAAAQPKICPFWQANQERLVQENLRGPLCSPSPGYPHPQSGQAQLMYHHLCGHLNRHLSPAQL